MPKRKASEDSGAATEPSPPKRVVRRNGTRTAVQRVRAGSKRNPPTEEQPAQATHARRRKPHSNSPLDPENTGDSTSSPNDEQGDHNMKRPQLPEDSDADELNIVSPSKLKPAEPSTPRLVLDCVEITTPKFVSKLRDLASPAVSSVRETLLRPPVTPLRRGNSEIMSSTMPKPIPFPLTPSKGRPPASPQQTLPQLLRAVPGTPTTPGRSPKKLSPSKSSAGRSSAQLSKQLPQVLPPHLGPCLRLQQHAVLASLKPSSHIFVDDDSNDEQPSTNAATYRQLQDLLLGSVTRGEGNSCLLVGPRGSGKTSVRLFQKYHAGYLFPTAKITEQVIESLPNKPIVIRLSGHTQQNDRLALREVAQQLSLQTGKSFLSGIEETEDENQNPFLDSIPSTSLPPPSHLPALISLLPTLARPTIVILDAFDLFAHHARQSLLYCLLDTVQSCRVGQGNNGLAVIGVTSRIDTVNLLEKRVKSRFSGRVLRTAPPVQSHYWINLSRRVLCIPIDAGEEWEYMWRLAVEKFFDDQKVKEVIEDTFALTRDVRLLQKVLVSDLFSPLQHSTGC